MNKIPLSKGLTSIFLWTLLISGSAGLGFLYYFHQLKSQIHDDQYQIVAVVQTSSDKESLKTVYLAELLGLSFDKPTNLFQFDTEEARQKLLGSHVIKEVNIKKIRPGTVFVEYSMRKPIAYSGDYANTALDTDGVFFPVSPFYTPKRLPEIRLGLIATNNVWGSSCKEDRAFLLAIEVLRILKTHFQGKPIHLSRVDVSHAFASSYGHREIVVMIEEDVEKVEGGRFVVTAYPRMLRFSVSGIEQAAKEYLVLREKLQGSKTSIIDLRIPQLAFISM
jgi:hypothetical protein